MVKEKRKFGGKVYTLFDKANTQKEAEEEAAGLRSYGSLARIVRGLQFKPRRRVVWYIYTR